MNERGAELVEVIALVAMLAMLALIVGPTFLAALQNHVIQVFALGVGT